MSRDFIASQQGREFKKSQNRDRIVRGTPSRTNFFYTIITARNDLLITAGSGLRQSRIFNPPEYARANVENQPSTAIANLTQSLSDPNDLVIPTNIFASGAKLRVVIDLVGFSEQYWPNREFNWGIVSASDPQIFGEIYFYDTAENDNWPVSYLNRGTIAALSFGINWEFPSEYDAFTVYEQNHPDMPENQTTLAIKAIMNSRRTGQFLHLNQNETFERLPRFWKKRITTIVRAKRATRINYPDASWSTLNYSGTLPVGGQYYERTGQAFAVNINGPNPTNPFTERSIFKPFENLPQYNHEMSQAVWGRVQSIEQVSDSATMETIRTDI